MFQKTVFHLTIMMYEYAKLDKELAELDTIVGIVRKDYSYLESILQNDFWRYVFFLKHRKPPGVLLAPHY